MDIRGLIEKLTALEAAGKKGVDEPMDYDPEKGEAHKRIRDRVADREEEQISKADDYDSYDLDDEGPKVKRMGGKYGSEYDSGDDEYKDEAQFKAGPAVTEPTGDDDKYPPVKEPRDKQTDEDNEVLNLIRGKQANEGKVEEEEEETNEGKKPDFLDVDKDGDKKEPMKKAIKDKEEDDVTKEDNEVLRMIRGKQVTEEEDELEECGMDEMSMAPPMGDREQPDSVNMNVSMNGTGEGGVADLLKVLKDIQDGPDTGSDIERMPALVDKSSSMVDDDYANEPDEAYGDVGMVTRTGDDLHSKGTEAPRANGGGNPMSLEDRLRGQFESLYNEIKNRG